MQCYVLKWRAIFVILVTKTCFATSIFLRAKHPQSMEKLWQSRPSERSFTITCAGSRNVCCGVAWLAMFSCGWFTLRKRESEYLLPVVGIKKLWNQIPLFTSSPSVSPFDFTFQFVTSKVLSASPDDSRPSGSCRYTITPPERAWDTATQPTQPKNHEKFPTPSSNFHNLSYQWFYNKHLLTWDKFQKNPSLLHCRNISRGNVLWICHKLKHKQLIVQLLPVGWLCWFSL